MSDYREITRAEINAFLRSAVILAMAKPEYINGGVRVTDVFMRAAVSGLIEEQTGRRPVWPKGPERAPEHERSGHG